MNQLFFSIMTILLLRSIDPSDLTTQSVIYTIFWTSYITVTIVYIYVRHIIKSNPNNKIINAQKPKSMMADPNEKVVFENITIANYDMRELNEYMKKNITSLIILGLIYYKWKPIVPLLFHSLHNLYQLYEHSLFKIHLLKYPSTGKLNRPWPVVDPIPSWIKNLTKEK